MTKEYEQSRTDVEKGLQVNPESKEFKLLKAKVYGIVMELFSCLHPS